MMSLDLVDLDLVGFGQSRIRGRKTRTPTSGLAESGFRIVSSLIASLTVTSVNIHACWGVISWRYASETII